MRSVCETNMRSVCEDTALESAHLCHSFAQFPGAQMASHWRNDTLNLQASPNLEPEPFPFQFPMRRSFCCGAQCAACEFVHVTNFVAFIWLHLIDLMAWALHEHYVAVQAMDGDGICASLAAFRAGHLLFEWPSEVGLAECNWCNSWQVSSSLKCFCCTSFAIVVWSFDHFWSRLITFDHFCFGPCQSVCQHNQHISSKKFLAALSSQFNFNLSPSKLFAWKWPSGKPCLETKGQSPSVTVSHFSQAEFWSRCTLLGGISTIFKTHRNQETLVSALQNHTPAMVPAR